MSVGAVALPIDGLDMQVCKTCGKTKPLGEFHKLHTVKLGVRSSCKKCECEKAMRWVDENPERALDAHLRRRFGITLEEYNAMLADQGGVCAICGNAAAIYSSPGGRRRQGRQVKPRLVVDHDHITGEVRGLLCVPCNRGIGFLRDDAEIVGNALKYLER